MAKLKGEDITALARLLASTLDMNELQMFVLEATGDELFKAYVGEGQPLRPTLNFLLLKLEEEGTTDKLLSVIYKERPNRADVRTEIARLVPEASTPLRTDAVTLVVQTRGFAQANEPANAFAPGLQRNIKPHLHQLDVRIWLDRLAQIERQVCRIEFNGNAAGTGFLVGPDAVLTNWHVVAAAKTAGTMDRLACRFDYLRLENNTRQPGRAVALHGDGCVSSSPFSPAELTDQPADPPPNAHQLDYALLRLSQSLGREDDRGWIKLPESTKTLEKGAPLLIVQHPDGAPMKLALDTNAIIDYNINKTRLRYATNTEAGSSGSPCFSMDWDILALHHFGDPAWNRSPLYNQGIPIGLIRTQINSDGHAAMLGT